MTAGARIHDRPAHRPRGAWRACCSTARAGSAARSPGCRRVPRRRAARKLASGAVDELHGVSSQEPRRAPSGDLQSNGSVPPFPGFTPVTPRRSHARPSVEIDFQPTEHPPPTTRSASSRARVKRTRRTTTSSTAASTSPKSRRTSSVTTSGCPTSTSRPPRTTCAKPARRLSSGRSRGDADPVDIARELHTAVHSAPSTGRGDKALLVVQSHRLEQGAFAQQVCRRLRRAEVSRAWHPGAEFRPRLPSGRPPQPRV